MDAFSVLVFVVAFGFVTAALVTFTLNIIGGHKEGYQISFDSKYQIATGFMVCMFAGPYLTIKNSLYFWRDGSLSNGVFMAAVFVCLLWSFFSGVLITKLLVTLGLLGV